MKPRLLLAAFAVRALAGSAWAETGRSNVLLIIGDDQGWTYFGFTGHPVVRTVASGSAGVAGRGVPECLRRPRGVGRVLSPSSPRQGFETKICDNNPPAGVQRRTTQRFTKRLPHQHHPLRPRSFAWLPGIVVQTSRVLKPFWAIST